jgi:hypothetical protein
VHTDAQTDGVISSAIHLILIGNIFTSLKSVMTNIEGLGILLHRDDNDDDDNGNYDDRSIY